LGRPPAGNRLIKTGSLTNRAVKNAAKTHAQVSRSVEALTEKGFKHLQDRDFINLYVDSCRIVRGFARYFRYLSGSGATAVGSLFKVLSKYCGF